MRSRVLERLARRLLNDPRDAPMLELLLCASLLPVGAIALFARFSWTLALVYLGVYAGWLLAPFVTMYHDTSHHRLFKRQYEWLNRYLDWLLAPLFGFTPETYYVHHIGMHHPEENLLADVSSTLAYRRDSLTDFGRYWLRFFFCYAEMAAYFRRTRRPRLARRFVVGESLYAAVLVLALVLHPQAALVVFVLPLLLGRSVLIIGNWAEHAFVDPAAPDNPYRASLNLLGARVNARCFNVGYHIGHHIKPRMHFTEMPVEFEHHLARYGAEDAIVLRDMHYPTVWLHLMTGNYARLARAFVQLPGAPLRTEEQVMALLRVRTRRLSVGGEASRVGSRARPAAAL
jgi:hypothetical protein